MDLSAQKNALLALQAEYQTRIDKITNHLENPQDELGHHWDDQAVSAREDDMRKNLLIEAENNLLKVNAALVRMDEGGYGECVVCGEPIEDGRLQAVPYTMYCIAHAK